MNQKRKKEYHNLFCSWAMGKGECDCGSPDHVHGEHCPLIAPERAAKMIDHAMSKARTAALDETISAIKSVPNGTAIKTISKHIQDFGDGYQRAKQDILATIENLKHKN